MEVERDGGKTWIRERKIQRFNNNKQKYFTIIKYLFIVQLRDGEQFRLCCDNANSISMGWKKENVFVLRRNILS